MNEWMNLNLYQRTNSEQYSEPFIACQDLSVRAFQILHVFPFTNHDQSGACAAEAGREALQGGLDDGGG